MSSKKMPIIIFN
uniref:Uncharacterized protein n=2 Tax=Anguilla anguilla TaxID=7936 RepID=A0A0E9VR73_ANGAN